MPKIKGFGLKDVDDLVDAKNEFSNEQLPVQLWNSGPTCKFCAFLVILLNLVC